MDTNTNGQGELGLGIANQISNCKEFASSLRVTKDKMDKKRKADLKGDYPSGLLNFYNMKQPFLNVEENIYILWVTPTSDGWEILRTPHDVMNFLIENDPRSLIAAHIPINAVVSLEDVEEYFVDCYATITI